MDVFAKIVELSVTPPPSNTFMIRRRLGFLIFGKLYGWKISYGLNHSVCSVI